MRTGRRPSAEQPGTAGAQGKVLQDNHAERLGGTRLLEESPVVWEGAGQLQSMGRSTQGGQEGVHEALPTLDSDSPGLASAGFLAQYPCPVPWKSTVRTATGSGQGCHGSQECGHSQPCPPGHGHPGTSLSQLAPSPKAGPAAASPARPCPFQLLTLLRGLVGADVITQIVSLL